MTTEQWLLVGSYLLTVVVTLLNFGSKIWKSKTGVKIEEGTYVGLLNTNIRLATERALKSEQEAVEAEKKFEEREKRLIKRIDDFEGKLNLTLQENITLKSQMSEMNMRQAMSDRLLNEQRIENETMKSKMEEMIKRQISSDKLIEEQRLAQTVSQRLIEEQRREIIALQDFSERLIAQVVGHDDTPVQYKPDK